MSKIDIILIIPLIWGAFMGFRKGLILELASLVGLILGIYGAIRFSDYTAKKLIEYVDVTQEWLGLISFLVTFVLIVFAVFLFARILDKALKLVALGLINRLLGLLFGLLKYALILSTLLYFFENINTKFQLTETNYREKSLLWEPMEMLVAPFQQMLTDFEIDKVKEEADQLLPNPESL